MLLIQNLGVAPVETFTLFGSSGSRDNAALIGQFGSGAKHAITTLLRANRKVVVYCGTTRMEFLTKPVEINDGISSRTEQQVYVQFGGTSKKKQDLGWVLGCGERDWGTNIPMAIREFVANAIDRTVKQGDNVPDAVTNCDLVVDIVPDASMRAMDGYTRIYIEECQQCRDYLGELQRRFLHFGSPRMLNQSILPKSAGYPNCQIYYHGVWVRELNSPSICDYNFTGDQIKIDESRNLDEYQARAAIGMRYRDAAAPEVAKLLTAVKDNTPCLEVGLDSYYLKPASWVGASEKQQQVWQQAWTMVFGESVACGKTQHHAGEFARKKGYSLGIIDSTTVLDAVKAYGIKGVEEVVDHSERNGRTVSAPTFEAIDAVNTVWEWVAATDLVGDKPKPTIRGFDEAVSAASECLGYMDNNVVYLRNDLGGQLLLETALEEVVHYVTGATDGSRDLQSFLFRLVTRWLA